MPGLYTFIMKKAIYYLNSMLGTRQPGRDIRLLVQVKDSGPSWIYGVIIGCRYTVNPG